MLLVLDLFLVIALIVLARIIVSIFALLLDTFLFFYDRFNGSLRVEVISDSHRRLVFFFLNLHRYGGFSVPCADIYELVRTDIVDKSKFHRVLVTHVVILLVTQTFFFAFKHVGHASLHMWLLVSIPYYGRLDVLSVDACCV